MKHIFLVNKISGKGTAYNNIDTIKKVCEELGVDYKIEVTEYPGHCEEIVKSYNDQKDITIYSVGGDGTYLDVVNAINNDIPIGLIPCGSGNDYYRYFGGINKDYENLIRNTIKNEPIVVDCGINNYMKFANTTSLGIDAKINFDASKMIRKTIITKGPAYILSIIANAIILKPCNVKMFVDGVDYSGSYYIISCMNGRFYGNGVEASPSSDLTDGYFDLVLYKKNTRFQVYKTLIKYLSGKATEKDNVQRIRCKHIEIDSENEMECQSDGENYMTNHLVIDMLEKYIKLKISK